MNITRLLPLALLVLAGCASTIDTDGGLVLEPGGRALGRIDVPAGSRTTVRLANEGPGRADFVIRQDGAGVLQEGPLGESTSTTESTEPVMLLLVVEAYEDARTNVSWSVSSSDGAAVRWELPPRD